MPARPAPERLPLTSADPLEPRFEELQALFPMALTDGRIDLEKLRAFLGEQGAGGPERYGLSWAGKSDALKVLRQLTTATLLPAPSESEKWDRTGNAIIEGDNLEVLKTLQHAYHGKVKLIYIDPPYNTGGDFIYVRAPLETELGIPKSPEEIRADFDEKDDRGVYRSLELRNTHRQFGRHNRANLWYPIYADPEGGSVALDKDERYSVEVWPLWEDGYEGCWTWGRAKVAQETFDLYAREVRGTWKVFRKARAIDEDGQVVRKKLKTIFAERAFHTEKGQQAFDELMGSGIFQAPKPVGLIQLLLKLGSDDDLILDFFGGSGTTAQAVLELNLEDGGSRNFVLVQLPEPTGRADFPTITEITKERVRRVIRRIEGRRSEQMQLSDSGQPIDLGFRVFKLSASSFSIWDPTLAPTDADELAKQWQLTADNVRPEVPEQALLYELMLKSGLPLAEKVTTVDAAGVTVHQMDEGRLVICLAREITQEAMRAMIALQPASILCLDVGFKGNDALKVNAQLECQSHGIQFRTA